MRTILLLIALPLFAAGAPRDPAAPVPPAEPAADATEYWMPLPPRTLSARIGFQNPMLSLTLNPPSDTEGMDVRYEPNVPMRVAVDFAYGPFVALVSGSTGLGTDEKRLYGESRVIDWQFRFFGRRLTYDFVYQDYAGFYIENSEDLDPSIGQDDPRILRPDIEKKHVAFQVFHTFSPETFSMGGAFDQNVRQTRSGGSWLASAGLDHHRILADFTLVPLTQQPKFGKLATFTGGEFYTAKVGGGYGYNHVFSEKWNLSGVLMLNGGLQKQRYFLDTGAVDTSEISLASNAKIGLTYNGEKYTGGIVAHLDGTAMKIGEGQVTSNAGMTTIFLGSRYDVAIPPLDSLSEWLFN